MSFEPPLSTPTSSSEKFRLECPYNSRKRRDGPFFEERNVKRRLIEQLESLSLDSARSMTHDNNNNLTKIQEANTPYFNQSPLNPEPTGEKTDFMDTESEHVVFIPSIEDFLSDNPDNVNSNQGNRLMVITNNVIGQSELTSKFNDDKNREILPFSLLVTENDHRADRYQRSKGLTQLDIKNKNIYDREDWYKQVIKYEGGPHEIIYRHFIRWWLRNQVSANTKIQDPYSYPHRPPTRDLFTFSRPPSRLIGSTNGDINMIDYTSFTSTLSATSTTTSTPEPPLPRKLFTEFASSSSIDNMDVDMD